MGAGLSQALSAKRAPHRWNAWRADPASRFLRERQRPLRRFQAAPALDRRSADKPEQFRMTAEPLPQFLISGPGRTLQAPYRRPDVVGDCDLDTPAARSPRRRGSYPPASLRPCSTEPATPAPLNIAG